MASENSVKIDLTNMSSVELATFIKEASAALEKKVKSESKILSKIETKKAESAPPKGVLPPQFAENHEWVQFVHNHMLTNGWESFIHKEIGAGRQSVEVEYPKSEMVAIKDAEGKEQMDEDGDTAYCYAFEDSVSAKYPSGQQPLLSHAMRLSKMYRTTKPDVYQEFLASYVPPAPIAASASSASASASASAAKPAVMTKAERDAQKEEKKQEKEREKERKAEEKRVEKARKERLKEEEKEQKKALKASAKLIPKGVVRVPVPVPIAKPASASAAVSVRPISVAKPILVKKPVPTIAWLPPKKGDLKRLMLNSVNYYVDHLNRVFPPETDEDGDEVPSDCVGVYKPATNTISDDENDFPEDEDD